MTLTIETGAGVRGANAYAPTAYVTTYLTNRGRETAWSALAAAEMEDAVIAATDYIETRWGGKFLGQREFEFTETSSTGSIVFAGLPSTTETIVVGDQTYTFISALTGVVNEVLIGADAAGTASNLYDALVADADGDATTYGTGTPANPHVTPVLATATITLTATADGISGDYTVLTTSATNTTANALSGGIDGGSQPLSFPRLYLRDRGGNLVCGVPMRLKQAMAEYADRARVELLSPDPAGDDTSGSVIRLKEKIGTLESDVTYSEGTYLQGSLKPYPAADRLLLEYLPMSGGTFR